MTKIIISTTVEEELHKQAINNNPRIRWADALAYGIQAKLGKNRVDEDLTTLKAQNQRLQRALDRYIVLTKDLQENLFKLKGVMEKDDLQKTPTSWTSSQVQIWGSWKETQYSQLGQDAA